MDVDSGRSFEDGGRYRFCHSNSLIRKASDIRNEPMAMPMMNAWFKSCLVYLLILVSFLWSFVVRCHLTEIAYCATECGVICLMCQWSGSIRLMCTKSGSVSLMLKSCGSLGKFCLVCNMVWQFRLILHRCVAV